MLSAQERLAEGVLPLRDGHRVEEVVTVAEVLAQAEELGSRDIETAMHGGCSDYHCACHLVLIEAAKLLRSQKALGLKAADQMERLIAERNDHAHDLARIMDALQHRRRSE